MTDLRRGLWLSPLLAAGLTLALAQPPEEPAAPAVSPSVVAVAPVGRYVGPHTCGTANCHGSVVPRDVFDVLQNEYFTWSQEDRHARAYEVLFSERSRAIGRNLGLAEPADAPACLACHVLAPPRELQAQPLELVDGVSCEACHGPASGWLGPHTEEGWSRERGRAAGMIDLADPARRGRLCLGCHLGMERRVVDHRLLAAGHPPLVFELDNYAAAMPAHWRSSPADGVPAWAVGQALALQREAELLAATSRTAGWPELAFLVCDDCHHSLAEERWRRAGSRDGTGEPGVPRWSPARWAVLHHLVAVVAPNELPALDAAVGRLAGRAGRLTAPAGEVAAAADEVARAAERVLPRLREAAWNEGMLTSLLGRIAGDRAAFERGDYGGAEQAALAAQTLVSALVQRRPEVLRGDLAEALEGLHRAIADPYHYDRERFGEQLERIERELRRLP